MLRTLHVVQLRNCHRVAWWRTVWTVLGGSLPESYLGLGWWMCSEILGLMEWWSIAALRDLTPLIILRGSFSLPFHWLVLDLLLQCWLDFKHLSRFTSWIGLMHGILHQNGGLSFFQLSRCFRSGIEFHSIIIFSFDARLKVLQVVWCIRLFLILLRCDHLSGGLGRIVFHCDLRINNNYICN